MAECEMQWGMAQKASIIDMNSNESESLGDVKIRRGRVGSVCLYEVTESELEELERGSPSEIYLNFALLCLSTGLSFLVTVLTTKIESDRLFSVFVAVTLVSLLSSLILFFIWFRIRKPIKSLISRIKNRVPPDIEESEEEEWKN